jgi:selenocysteine-specific elongation factor
VAPRHIIIGTAGHIDHGKSALVLALTGTDPDRLKEEKARGITIELGFAHWTTDEFAFSFVDVPGHERFVKNMLAGVGGFDAVVLVVAADESVMPQTREHFEICRLLGVSHGLVAVTKSDLADADTIELVRMESRELVAGSFLADAPILPVSARTGQGMDALREALVALARRVPRRASSGAARLPIDRAFSVRGFGTVVTGTLLSGRVRVDDELAVLPGGRGTKVRGLQVHGAAAPEAQAGQRVAANLGGIELEDLHRGDTLLTPDTLEPSRMIDARLQVVTGARALRHGARVRFHQGTSELLGRAAIAAILSPADDHLGGTSRGGGAKGPSGTVPLAPGAEVPGGGEAYVRLRLESPAVVSRGDRFILRAYSPPVTVAGGLVLDPHPARGAIRTPAARERFEQIDPRGDARDVAASRAVSAMVNERGAQGFAVASLVSRAGVEPGGVAAAIDRLTGAGLATRVADLLVAPAVLNRLSREALARLGDHHRAAPLSDGMPREELRERVFARAGEGVFEWVLSDLQAANKAGGRDRIALASHRISLTGEEERARGAIEQAFRAAGLRPADVKEVGQVLGVGPDVLDRIVKLLLRQKVLVKLEAICFHHLALDQLKRDMSALKAGGGDAVRIDVATFKDRYGVSRKYAIPLLEFLDRERITRRVGDARVLI